MSVDLAKRKSMLTIQSSSSTYNGQANQPLRIIDCFVCRTAKSRLPMFASV